MYNDYYPRHTDEPPDTALTDAIYHILIAAKLHALASTANDTDLDEPPPDAQPIQPRRRTRNASGHPYVYAHQFGWQVRIRYTDHTHRQKFFGPGMTEETKRAALAWRDAVLRGEA